MEARGPQSRGTRHKKMNVSENWSSSDDSSSSDGEESARIKEVVEESLGSMKDAKSLTKQEKLHSNEEKKNKPSLRNVSLWVDFQNEDLQTTPEFRSFLSQRLSKHIDGLVTMTNEIRQRDTLPDEKIGVKLLNSSVSFVDIERNINFQNERQKRRRIPSASNSDSEGEANRLSEAAVSLDFIMTNASALQGSSENDKQKTVVKKHNKKYNNESHVDRDDGIDAKKVKKPKKKRKKCISENGLVKEDTCLLTTIGLALKQNRDQANENVVDKVECEGEAPVSKRVKKQKKKKRERNISESGLIKEDTRLPTTTSLNSTENKGQGRETVINKIELKGNKKGNEVGEIPLSKGNKKQKKKGKEKTYNEIVYNGGNRILTTVPSVLKKNNDESSKIRTDNDLLQSNDIGNLDNCSSGKIRKKKKRKKEEMK